MLLLGGARPRRGRSLSKLQPDTLITPSLRLVRPLAEGGMATVWVARHLGLQTDVVVKFISAELARDPEALARFRREAAAAAEVKSPHVVQMIDHGLTDAGVPYIAMELLEGENLEARVQRERVLSPGEVAGIVLQVSRALTRAHEKKIVHRDIKPENIFLCETGDEEAFVKVLDFGIAKVSLPEELHTRTGAVIGSPLWMSPEQVLGLKSVDFRTDLWSLGVVAFFALTGRVPFHGMSVGALALAISKGDLPLPSQSNPSLSPAIDHWFARACAREAMARFPSARAMADALVSAVGGPAFARVRSREEPSMSSLPTTARVPKSASPSPEGVSALPLAARLTSIAARASRRTWALVAGGALVLGTASGVVAWELSRGAPSSDAQSASSASSAAESSAPSVAASADAESPVPLLVEEPIDAAATDAATKPRTKPKTKTTAAPKKPKPPK
jgi:serine/threonine-protein kinase